MMYKMTGLRWARSRLLAQALINGVAELGNHKIEFKDPVAIFYYKGTPITEFDFRTFQFKDIPTNFEHTKSTPNQRKIARFAVFEVTGVVPLDMPRIPNVRIKAGDRNDAGNCINSVFPLCGDST